MKKLTPIMFAVALAMGIGSAYAGSGKDFLNRGIPPGFYHVEKTANEGDGKFHYPCDDWDQDHGCEHGVSADHDHHHHHHHGGEPSSPWWW